MHHRNIYHKLPLLLRLHVSHQRIIEEKESQVSDSFDRYSLGFEILVFKERKSEQKKAVSKIIHITVQ